ncbi:MAG: hypothetical protein WAO35_01620 [Terriglobia bacterium]
MSLRKKQKMTQEKISANRRNGRGWHGPATPEGRERMRAAHLRHGFYLKAEDMALRSLGEDPAQFQDLLEELWKEFNPVGSLQEGLVIRLARATWLMNRADRMQEGYAVRQAKEASMGRGDQLHAQMMRLKMTGDILRRLVQAVAHEHYVTTPHDLDMMKNFHQEGVLKEMGEIALALFYQLQPPGTGEDGIDPEVQSRNALRRIKEIFGLSGDTPPTPSVAPGFRLPQQCQQDAGATADVAPDFSPAPAGPSHSSGQALKASATSACACLSTNTGQLSVSAEQPEENDQRYPSITAAEWEARERPRQLLENILTRQVEICEAQRQAILKESLAGPSPYERAAEIAPTHRNAPLVRRMQDSNFRELRRVTNLLLKIQRRQRQVGGVEQQGENPGSAGRKLSRHGRENRA